MSAALHPVLSNTKAIEAEIVRRARVKYFCDPLGYVQWAYPWGQGSLAKSTGPDEWQLQFLIDLGRHAQRQFAEFEATGQSMPIRMAVASGHGIGKSTLNAWLVDWAMLRTRARGTITANTYMQLETKTWAAVQTWARLNRMRDEYTCVAGAYYHRDNRESWLCSPQSCKEENSEAFAGQHAADSTSFYLFDEASAIPEKIWEVAEGGLTDGMPMFFAFGNPTKSNGKFHRVCFGDERNLWDSRSIDSRTTRFPNKELIQQWLETHGEDSDFFRVRVRGLPPRASDLQFIDTERILEAQKRPAVHLADDPLVAALDVARGGSDSNVIRFRRGADASSIPPIRIPGEQSRDSMRLVSVATEILGRDFGNGLRVAVLFVDATGVGGPIADRLRQMGHRNVIDVQFGAMSPEPRYVNLRSYMWAKMREWLTIGSIDADRRLETDLGGPGYTHDKRDRLLLESKEDMKKRGLDSPDDGDALAMTFAQVVAPKRTPPPKPVYGLPNGPSWMG